MLGLLDLPSELLAQIFAPFEAAPIIDEDGHIRAWEPHEGLPTISAARLACRALNELLSPMLCPLFHGRLDKHTTQRIEGLSRNTLITKGIRGFQLNLCFRPERFATDMDQFTYMLMSKVERLEDSCRYQREPQWMDPQHVDPADEIWYRQLWAAGRKFRTLYHSWQLFVEPDEDKVLSSEYCADQRLLRECFASYSAKYQEQNAILDDGSYVQCIGQAMAMCKQPITLTFEDNEMPLLDIDEYAIAEDDSYLMQVIMVPHDWFHFEEVPASVLTELPIVADRLGARLQGLCISSFPICQGIQRLIPRGYSFVPRKAWDDLAHACRNLRVLRFGKHHKHRTALRQEAFSAEDRGVIDGYLGAVSSGTGLQTVDINMTRLGIQKGLMYPLPGAMLNCLHQSSLRQVRIVGIIVSGICLETWVVGLPASRMKSLMLSNIYLLGGSFVRIADGLREFKQSSPKCLIHISRLGTGDEAPEEVVNSESTMLPGLLPIIDGTLMSRLRADVNGEDGANPLLGIEQN